MKKWTMVLGCALLVVTGCKRESGTVTGPDGKKLTLTYPKQVDVAPGGTTKVVLTVARTNFDEPVTVEISGLPTGVSVADKDMTIAKGVTEGNFFLTATEAAKPGNGLAFKVTAKSAGMVNGPFDVKLTVEEKKVSAAQQRDDLRAAIKPQLDSANKAIIALEANAKTATGEAKAATEKQLVKIREMRDSLQKDMDRSQAVAADAWDDFSRGCHKAASDLSDATKKALDKLNK